MTEDAVSLRRFQKRYAQTALAKFGGGKKVIVADVHPGSGKTLAVLHVANELYRQKEIDSCVVFVPRLNLCRQFELDWKRYRSEWYAQPSMPPITHRDNDPPLLRGNAFGYVTTYASLVSKPQLHLNFVKSHPRVMLIVDEAQQLGTERDFGGTQSAKYIEELAQYVKYIQVVTGTPYRSDGSPLLFADYTDPDEYGRRYLESDVTASYLEGVSEGYLRPFEYKLADGRAIYEYLDGGEELLQLSQPNQGWYHILEDEDFWSAMVDLAIEQVQKVQRHVDPRLCGLIGAFGQKQAKKIAKYIRRKHPDIKALIAVSDEKESQRNLEEFKRKEYDILITVRMAYVGYDHKPISVVLLLSNFRDNGYLDQYFARGMRVMPDIPIEKQVLYAIVPDDPKMAKYVEEKRVESQKGLKERRRRLGITTGGVQRPMGFVYGGEVTQLRAQGMNPDGDLNSEELPVIEKIQNEYKMIAPPTETGRMIRDLGFPISEAANRLGVIRPKGGTEILPLTEKEKEERARKKTNDFAKHCDAILGRICGTEPPWGETWKQCLRHFKRKTFTNASLKEIEKAYCWMQEEWEPYLNRKLEEDRDRWGGMHELPRMA